MIDVDTPIMATTPTTIKAEEITLAQSTELPINSPTNEWKSEAVIEATDRYLSTATALVVMNPSEKNSLMRFAAVVSQENLTSKADTLIDTTASLNFVSKRFKSSS